MHDESSQSITTTVTIDYLTAPIYGLGTVARQNLEDVVGPAVPPAHRPRHKMNILLHALYHYFELMNARDEAWLTETAQAARLFEQLTGDSVLVEQVRRDRTTQPE